MDALLAVDDRGSRETAHAAAVEALVTFRLFMAQRAHDVAVLRVDVKGAVLGIVAVAHAVMALEARVRVLPRCGQISRRLLLRRAGRQAGARDDPRRSQEAATRDTAPTHHICHVFLSSKIENSSARSDDGGPCAGALLHVARTLP